MGKGVLQAQAAEEIKRSLDKIEREKAEAIERANALEKQLKISADPVMTEFGYYFQAAQEQLNKLVELAARAQAENRKKLAAAIRALLNKTAEVIKDEN